MTENDVVSLKCKLFCGNSILFGSFPFVGHLCLGLLNGCAGLAQSFETILRHSDQLQSETNAQRIETKCSQFADVQVT